jgi:membrane-bound serine protease (ClpP class)
VRARERAPAGTKRYLLPLALIVAALLPAAGCGDIGVRRGEVLVLSADGVVNPVMVRYLDRGIDAGERRGAAAVLIELDTPGGLGTSMRDIVQRIQAARVPVIVYVAPEGAQAASAGTFITLAAPVAAMAPGTNIGAASPVDVSGKDIEGTLGNKATNDAAAFIRSIAEQRGRNADWAEQAVRAAAAVSASDAVRLNVVDMVAPSRWELLRAVDGRAVATAGGAVTLRTADAPVREARPSLAEDILNLLSDPNIAFLLLSIGGLALLFELLHPGAIVPGIVGALSLVLAFFALGTLPANWAALILVGLAFAFFTAEVLVSGFGLFAAAGAVSLALGGLFLVDGGGPLPAVSLWLIAGVTIGIALFFALIVASLRRVRTRPRAHFGVAGLIGRQAVAVSPLDPDGYVLLDGERWAAHAVGARVRPGERVVITEVRGLHLRVSPTRAGSEFEVSDSPLGDWLDREIGSVRSEPRSGGGEWKAPFG